MTWKVYATPPPNPLPKVPVDLSGVPETMHEDPGAYVPESGLVNAVNAAIALSQPLLLTGAPGTGKTQLAFSVAAQLGLGTPLVFLTKTTSTARDLFYRYDALLHFREARSESVIHKGEHDEDHSIIERYIEFDALGLAILLAMPRERFGWMLRGEMAQRPQGRSVVLIDEVDKAPRDFPNDLLFEIENYEFRVRETRLPPIRAPKELRPIVILTSNSERPLPDPFLRRCVFYHLKPPTEAELNAIVERRLPKEYAEHSWIADAIRLFLEVREVTPEKSPATAELLGWIRYLVAIQKEELRTPISDSIPIESLPLLAKTKDNLDKLKASKLTA